MHTINLKTNLFNIYKTKEAQMNAINLRKNRLTENEYNEKVKFANYYKETFLIWHDILFGNYSDAKNKLIKYKAK